MHFSIDDLLQGGFHSDKIRLKALYLVSAFDYYFKISLKKKFGLKMSGKF